MGFKRATVRYSETPLPTTRSGGRTAWDERMGSARVQAENWRVMALACLGVALVLSAALIWQGSRARITPFVLRWIRWDK